MGEYAKWAALRMRRKDIARALAGKLFRGLARFLPSSQYKLRLRQLAWDAASGDWERRSGFLEPAIERLRCQQASALPARPKIVHLIGSLQSGGAERQLCNFLVGAHRRGYDVSVILLMEPVAEHDHYRELLAQEKIPVKVAGKIFDPRFTQAIKSLPFGEEMLKAIPEEFSQWTIDILGELLCEPPHILHAWLDHTNVWGGVAALLANVPLIVLSTRNVHPLNFPYLATPYFQQMYRRLAASPNVRFINNSHAGAASYAEWLDLPLQRFAVVLNGVDLAGMRRASPEAVRAFSEEMGLPESCRLIAGIFRLSDEKQPFVFLEVVRRVLEKIPDAYVAIAGIGPLEKEMRAFIDTHGLKKRVMLLGRRSDVTIILSAADVLLLTSRHEGTPNVLLEAQWLGCPVVSTRAGGAVDAVAEGESGYLVEVGDLDGIESAVLNVLKEERLARNMAQAGPEFIRKKFGVDRMVEETIAVYCLPSPHEQCADKPATHAASQRINPEQAAGCSGSGVTQ